MIKKTLPKIFTLILLVLTTFFAQAQTKQDSIWERNYQKRIQKSKLNGIYIPRNLGDAHARLNRLISPEARQKFMNMSEDQVRHKLFFSLGRWISFNWGFYDGSRLSHRLRKLGIYHPDDMAEFIMITYHRKLNHRELGAKELIEAFAKKRKKELEKRRKVTILSKS